MKMKTQMDLAKSENQPPANQTTTTTSSNNKNEQRELRENGVSLGWTMWDRKQEQASRVKVQAESTACWLQALKSSLLTNVTRTHTAFLLSNPLTPDPWAITPNFLYC
jgi:vacuolar-type H+-ATPase catalytic subunit A/Vma1